MILPAEAAAVLLPLAPAFTAPDLPPLRRCWPSPPSSPPADAPSPTCCAPSAGLAPGHRTSYQRVLSCARWSGLQLACLLCRLVLRPAARRPPRRARRRRHRRRPQGQARLRQGPPPRPGPLHPLLHRLALRPQVGRPGRAGPLPLRHAGPGPCRCWSTCTAARRTTAAAAGRTAPRPNCCAGWRPCCCAGSPTAASCSSATPATARTRWPASAPPAAAG